MKTHLDIAHEGTLGNEGRTRMTFDEDSTAHLMSILTDLYKDPEMAIIREYSTNVLDSHVAAGNTDPIQVDLPSSLRPTLTIKDFGLGMSEATIMEQFSKYGWSSKRYSDDLVGTLGIGCKSALSYTSQFTMIATHNGRRCEVLITREADGGGSLQVIEAYDVDEPNGVEVQIPCDRHSIGMMANKAQQFFQLWDPGTVLLNGEPVASLWDTSIDHGDAILRLDPDVILARGLEADVIVMGNVPYPVDSKFVAKRQQQRSSYGDRGIVEPLCRAGYQAGYRVAARVPIGTVSFTPAREALMDNKRSKECVDETRQFCGSVLQKVVSSDIEFAPDAYTALERALKWRRALGNQTAFRYNGVLIPTSFQGPADHTWSWNPNSTYNDRTESHRSGYLSAEHALQALHVEGFTTQGLRGDQKEKLRKYIADNGIEFPVNAQGYRGDRIYLYSEPLSPRGWIRDDQIIDWEDVKLVDLGKPKVQRQRNKVSMWRTVVGENELPRDDVSGKVAFTPAANKYINRLALWQGVNPGTLVILPTNQEKKFFKDFPDALNARDFLLKEISEFVADITPQESYCIQWKYNDEFARYLERCATPKEILDPALRTFCQMLRMTDPGGALSARWSNLLRAYGEVKGTIFVNDDPANLLTYEAAKMPDYGSIKDQSFKLREQYPLLTEARIMDSSVIEYFNALYTYRQQKAQTATVTRLLPVPVMPTVGVAMAGR